MAKKRNAAKSPAATLKGPQLPRWRQVLVLVSIVPMIAGIILFAASWFGAVWIGNTTTQTVAGALLAFFGFTLSNAAQGKWLLTGAWALLAIAVWLLISPPTEALRWIGAAAGAAGMVLVLMAFIERYRQIRSAS